MPVVVVAAVLAALSGAFCYALAAALQQYEACRAPAGGVADPRLLWRLAHRPLWVAGVAATGLGAGLHLVALSQGPLTLVQPLGVTGLLFAVPLAAALGNHRVRLWELFAASLVLVGLAALLGAWPRGGGVDLPGPGPVVGLLLTAGGLTAISTAAAAVVTGPVRSLLLAVGAGTAFGTTSALARVLMQLDGQAGSLSAMVLASAGIALLAPVGFLLTQNAYRAGGFAAALATVTVVDPLVAAVGGVLLLREPFPVAPGQALAVAVAAMVVTAGITVLARSPAHTPGSRPAPAGTSPASESAAARIRCRRGRPPTPRASGELTRSSRLPRILIGADTYHPDVNGAAYFTHRLAAGLAARGYEIHVLCPSVTGPASVIERDGVIVHRLRSVRTPLHPSFRITRPLLVRVEIGRVLRDVDPDVVHVQAHFLVGRALLHAASGRVPLVATNHFMPENLVAYLRIPAPARSLVCALAWRDFTQMFNHADLVTTPTRTAADLIQSKGLRPAVRPVSCGIDLNRFRIRGAVGRTPGLFGLPDRPTLLFVGRLDPEKHLHELVAALPLIRCRVDAQLVLVGTGGQRDRLAALADRAGVGQQVHFLGFVPDEQLPDVYAAADVFCMPGVAELQSLVTLEAMASGLPVIAADAMALPHLVRPHLNGYLYPPGDLDELSAHAVHLLGSLELRRRMGAASRDIAGKHDAAYTLDQFEDLYAGLGATSPTTRADEQELTQVSAVPAGLPLLAETRT